MYKIYMPFSGYICFNKVCHYSLTIIGVNLTGTQNDKNNQEHLNFPSNPKISLQSQAKINHSSCGHINT